MYHEVYLNSQTTNKQIPEGLYPGKNPKVLSAIVPEETGRRKSKMAALNREHSYLISTIPTAKPMLLRPSITAILFRTLSVTIESQRSKMEAFRRYLHGMSVKIGYFSVYKS